MSNHTATETTRQRNARLRTDVAEARTALEAAHDAHATAHAAACDAPESADWEAVYALEAAYHEARTDLGLAESAYTLRDVPQASRDLVAANID
jgi:hypothetical protein